MSFDSIRYSRGQLEILDQLQLPFRCVYVQISTVERAVKSIRTMQVRGAPAIAMVGILSLAVELWHKQYGSTRDLVDNIKKNLVQLVEARPTAVNMANARMKLLDLLSRLQKGPDFTKDTIKTRMLDAIETMFAEDVETNKQIGDNGATAVANTFGGKMGVVLTHCNTGTLATSGYGTALGVIRSLFRGGVLEHVYFTETRPVNQGARLTAFELLADKIPSTLICDSAASWLMCKRQVNAVVVGADSVALNGDVANKIGTYGLAVAAKHHKIPFFVAFPTTTISGKAKTGSNIFLEERGSSEMREISGVMTAPSKTQCWNPAFDVTPAEFVTGGYLSERGLGRVEDLQTWLPLQSVSEPDMSSGLRWDF